jgi:hypothetical protein
MAKNLTTLYPGKTDVDANNPNGTFKNRTSDALKDGTPFEKGWASDVWGFLSHILKRAGISPNGAEENEVNSQYYDALDQVIGGRSVDFETKNLITNFTSATQGTAKADRLSLIDSSGIPKYVDNLNIIFTMPTDLESGTSEKNSTDYGAWVDSDLNKRLVPDLTGTTTATTAGKLPDAGATFLTDLVKAGDIAYNLTTKQKTTVSLDATLEGEVSVTDDIFTNGDSYKIVKMSPQGLGENKERLCTFFNNLSGDFDNSYYTQIQDKKRYTDAAGDFNVTAPNLTTTKAELSIKQVNDFTGKGYWKVEGNYDLELTVATGDITINTTGLVFSAQAQACPGYQLNSTGVYTAISRCEPNTGNIRIQYSAAAATLIVCSFDSFLGKKPTFHN